MLCDNHGRSRPNVFDARFSFCPNLIKFAQILITFAQILPKKNFLEDAVAPPESLAPTSLLTKLKIPLS